MAHSHFFSPSRTILISMSLAILVGALILSFPFCQSQPVSPIDVLFTATSCTCVTGLLTVPVNAFNDFGLIIMMILMQIGGLGLITLTLFVVSLFVNLGLATQVIAGEMLDLESWKNTRKILIFIIGLTFILESIGAIAIYQTLKHHFPTGKAVLYSCFHAISSFCNAGMTPFTNGMVDFNTSYTMMLTTSFLMCAGGLGFITWNEIFNRYGPFSLTKHTAPLALQTRVILHYYFFFVIASTILFWLLEHNNTFEMMSRPVQLLNAFFTSVASRSGGYMSVYPNDMQHASLFALILNAFVGSAPGSTGSGVKITTAAIFIATINAAILNKAAVNIKGRRLMKDQIYRALAVVTLSIVWIVITTFCLLITEKTWSFLDIFFETMSAYTTLGASIGITPYLSVVGKCLIMLSMFIGRIGSLTLLIALRKRVDSSEYSYPEERMMIT